MDLEQVEHLVTIAYFLYKMYREWRNEKRSNAKGTAGKRKPKAKKRNHR